MEHKEMSRIRQVSVLVPAIILALLVVSPVQASSISLDPAGGSPSAVATVQSSISAFESAFSARAGCIGSASVIFEVLSGRKGEYRTADAVVAVNPDREVATMPATVSHELGHHAMLTCRAYRDSDFTSAFYAAQGIPIERGWFDASAGWSGIPAEHFAEAAVMIVQGSTDGRIPVSKEAVDILRRWLDGRPMPAIAASAPEPVLAAEETAPQTATTAQPTPTATVVVAPTPPNGEMAVALSAAPASSELGRQTVRTLWCGWLRPI
jgi:hypothetical protein